MVYAFDMDVVTSFICIYLFNRMIVDRGGSMSGCSKHSGNASNSFFGINGEAVEAAVCSRRYLVNVVRCR